MLYGKQEIDGFMYEFDTWNGAMKLGWKSKDGKKYYYTSPELPKESVV